MVQDLGDAFPGIESRPEVCDGEACVVRTRIPIWLLVQARRLGTSDVDILRSYPTLRVEDLANAWAYARSHAGGKLTSRFETTRRFDGELLCQ